mmetsp:Transcript_55303/g.129477  ORF Transcript_55303/g.129477 Transcript_55303/m.129477 type:complete len:156 (-) Transcript_55303:40-507(-)
MQEPFGLPPDAQQLSDAYGEVLEDEKTFEDHHINDPRRSYVVELECFANKTICMGDAASGIIINVECDFLHHYHPYLIQPSDTVYSLKKQIQRQWAGRVPPDTQQLKFGSELLEDGKTFEDYSIQDKAILDMVCFATYRDPRGAEHLVEPCVSKP